MKNMKNRGGRPPGRLRRSISITLPCSLIEQLDARAVQLDLARSQIVTSLIRATLTREAPE
jgi:metal-responsive CopG/Arc/MetJ family transcriptional regulator